MNMNENTINGKWLEIKGDVIKAWGKLTDEDLEKTKGDIKAIGGLIQQKYGETQDRYHEKLAGIMKRFESHKDAAVESVKAPLKS